jgi:hypothetical protein
MSEPQTVGDFYAAMRPTPMSPEEMARLREAKLPDPAPAPKPALTRPADDAEYASFFAALMPPPPATIMVELDLMRLSVKALYAIAADCPELAMLAHDAIVDKARRRIGVLNL